MQISVNVSRDVLYCGRDNCVTDLGTWETIPEKARRSRKTPDDVFRAVAAVLPPTRSGANLISR